MSVHKTSVARNPAQRDEGLFAVCRNHCVAPEQQHKRALQPVSVGGDHYQFDTFQHGTFEDHHFARAQTCRRSGFFGLLLLVVACASHEQGARRRVDATASNTGSEADVAAIVGTVVAEGDTGTATDSGIADLSNVTTTPPPVTVPTDTGEASPTPADREEPVEPATNRPAFDARLMGTWTANQTQVVNIKNLGPFKDHEVHSLVFSPDGHLTWHMDRGLASAYPELYHLVDVVGGTAINDLAVGPSVMVITVDSYNLALDWWTGSGQSGFGPGRGQRFLVGSKIYCIYQLGAGSAQSMTLKCYFPQFPMLAETFDDEAIVAGLPLNHNERTYDYIKQMCLVINLSKARP